MKSLGILTSGGDNAGLNAVVRGATRTAIVRGLQMYGIRQGYLGLKDGRIFPLNTRIVSGTLQQGGTWIGTARLPEWPKDARIRREAVRNMNRFNIGGLIVCGGNGSLSGAHTLAKEGFPVIGIPGSIDDDVNGTDVCLGVDTALNVIIEAIDRIKDCAASIQRAFVVEVMGRDCGALALMAASATGAEVCLVPELPAPSMEEIVEIISTAYSKGKTHCILVVAEGWKPGASQLVKYLNDHQDSTGFDCRLTALGYTQRGGSPSYRDRYFGTLMSTAAVDALIAGETDKMVAVVDGKIQLVPLEGVVGNLKPLNRDLLKLFFEHNVHA